MVVYDLFLILTAVELLLPARYYMFFQVCGVLVQYPNTDGQINDYSELIEKAHSQKKKVSLCEA